MVYTFTLYPSSCTLFLLFVGFLGVIFLGVVFVVAFVVVAFGGYAFEGNFVQDAADDAGLALFHLGLAGEDLFAAGLVVFGDKDDAIAGFGDDGRVDDHTNGRSVYDDAIEGVAELQQEVGKDFGIQQVDGVGNGGAGGDHHNAVGTGLVDDILEGAVAGQIVGQTVGFSAGGEAGGLHHKGAADIRVDQEHASAAAGQVIGQLEGDKGLALGHVVAGDHKGLYVGAGKGQIGADGVEGFLAVVIQLSNVVQLCFAGAGRGHFRFRLRLRGFGRRHEMVTGVHVGVLVLLIHALHGDHTQERHAQLARDILGGTDIVVHQVKDDDDRGREDSADKEAEDEVLGLLGRALGGGFQRFAEDAGLLGVHLFRDKGPGHVGIGIRKPLGVLGAPRGGGDIQDAGTGGVADADHLLDLGIGHVPAQFPEDRLMDGPVFEDLDIIAGQLGTDLQVRQGDGGFLGVKDIELGSRLIGRLFDEGIHGKHDAGAEDRGKQDPLDMVQQSIKQINEVDFGLLVGRLLAVAGRFDGHGRHRTLGAASSHFVCHGMLSLLMRIFGAGPRQVSARKGQRWEDRRTGPPRKD